MFVLDILPIGYFLLLSPYKRLNFTESGRRLNYSASASDDSYKDWGFNQRECMVNQLAFEHQNDRKASPLDSEEFELLTFGEIGPILDVRIDDDFFVPCSLPGENDSTEKLSREIEKLGNTILEKDLDIEKVVFDFSKVDYMNSKVLSVFLELNNTLKPKNIEIEFYGLSQNLKEVFERTKLHRIFTVR